MVHSRNCYSLKNFRLIILSLNLVGTDIDLRKSKVPDLKTYAQVSGVLKVFDFQILRNLNKYQRYVP